MFGLKPAGQYHGSGANSTADTRYGLNIDYNLGLLRAEENQMLSNPPSVARHFPPQVRELGLHLLSSSS